ncbi:MAG: LysR family transcriptional regulator ArgP [Moritella sp.]|uniref:LysR family transcriptional regulator ArgP n=1 Tax=Moritella sp. TaxID=78556 RepID=UPI0029A13F12|nr:LysR family transcriptional regulator ArgP [Moritella sp.]MDX2319255.1 LysR family transcriptional regulator ArgP [Moritella sp.]
MDYKLLHALQVVIEQQSFERAAAVLCISQPAVSQRIKLLEEYVSLPVLIRSKPLVATDIGQRLLTHYKQVQHLEAELLPSISATSIGKSVVMAIAVNADSLATWFIPALAPLLKQYPIELNLHIMDEARTLEKVKAGETFGALSLQSKSLPGCEATLLGELHYALVATPSFVQQYLAQGITQQALRKAPAVSFDHKDDMHIKFIQQHFDLAGGSYPCHIVRSSEAFVAMANAGVAYCLIPELQIQDELAAGSLVKLTETQLTIPLYWHRWILLKGLYKQVSEQIITAAKHTIS